jgi:hypothetical protein
MSLGHIHMGMVDCQEKNIKFRRYKHRNHRYGIVNILVVEIGKYNALELIK